MIYLFEGYSLDSDLRELRRGTDLVAVEPQVFDLLHYLICKRDRVVSKDDMIAAVWNGRIVSESALTSRLTAVRHAVGDSGEEQRLIRTMARKGLRFVGEVREGRPSAPGGSSAAATPQPVHKPSIAVLPFVNMSGDPEQKYFSDGITEDIITELSRFRDLAVVARASSFVYRGNTASIRQVGRELRADFVLEGSVRRMGNRIRITAQLIDATTENHVWAERYDRSIEDVFAIHDEITATIVSSLIGQIDNAIVLRARTKPPASWQAYDYLLSGIVAVVAERFSPAVHLRAIENFERATEIDPQYARAFGWIALCYNRMALFFCKGNEEEFIRLRTLSRENARRAVALDGNNVEALSILGWLQIREGGFAEGERLVERAYSINRNDGIFAMRFVTALIYLGKPEQAVRLAEATVQRTRPHPEWFLSDMAEAYFYARRNDESVALYEKAPDVDIIENRAAAVCAFAYADKLDGARLQAERYVEQMRANWLGDPDAGISEMLQWEFQHFLPRSRREDVDYVRDGLRKAGMPA